MISHLQTLGYSAPLPCLISFRHRYLPGVWNLFYGFLSHCLTPQATGLDKANRNFIELFLGFCFHRQIDYAWLIWTEIREAVAQKTTRRSKTYLPYPRFFQLIISHVMLENPMITERSTLNPIRPTTIKFQTAPPLEENDRTETYPRAAMGPYEPEDPIHAVEPEKREEGELEREKLMESLGTERLGSGQQAEGIQGESKEFRSLSGDTADYYSFEMFGGGEMKGKRKLK